MDRLAFVVVVLVATCLCAQEPPRTAFARDTWVLTLYSGFAKGFGDDQGEHGAPFNLGIGRYFSDNWAFNLEGSYTLVNKPTTAGPGMNLILRGHLWEREGTSLFIDGGAGIVYFDRAFPRGGTHFNFTLHAGVGMTFPLDENVYLMAIVRYWHVSNMFTRGQGRNPSVDGLGAVFGVMWTW